MPKKSTRRRSITTVQKQTKKKVSLQRRLSFLAVSVVAFLCASFWALHWQTTEAASTQPISLSALFSFATSTPTPQIDLHKIQNINDLLTPPSATPTSSLRPTQQPSPTENNGYCLYVPVFMYHHIEPYDKATAEGHASLTVDSGWFAQQMAYLSKNGYTSLSLDQLVNAIRTHQSIPAKSYVVTLDDGYSDAYDYAYPIFKQYHIIGNVMIPTGLINNAGYMSWDELKEMQNSGVVAIYNHTWSHSPLGSDSADKIQFEMTTSQNQFQQFLNMTPTIMAYPYGSFSNLAVSLLKKDNFIAAFTTLPGNNECEGNIMELPRVRIGNASMSSYGY